MFVALVERHAPPLRGANLLEKQMSEKLLPFRTFARERLRRAPRTLERWYAAGAAGLPKLIRIGAFKLVSESEADAFVRSVIRKGALPGQQNYELRGAAATRVAEQRAREEAKSAIPTQPKSARRQVAPKTPRRTRVEA